MPMPRVYSSEDVAQNGGNTQLIFGAPVANTNNSYNGRFRSSCIGAMFCVML